MMIYILQFAQPLGNPDKARGQARFYVGFCEDDRLTERLEEHKSGHGAAITRAAVAKGIPFRVIWTMKGNRTDERNIKKQKNTPRMVRKLIRDGYLDSGIQQ